MQQVSAASQVIIAIIPIVGIVMGSLVVFFYVLWGHRERMQMIDRGLYAPAPFNMEAFCLLSGILLVAVGAVLTVMFLVLGPIGYGLLGGLIPLSVGAGFLAFQRLNARRDR